MRWLLNMSALLATLTFLSACTTAQQNSANRPVATTPKPVIFYLDRVGPFVIGSPYVDVAATPQTGVAIFLRNQR